MAEREMQFPWRRPAEEVLADLATSLDNGLDNDEARARLERHGENRLEAAAAVPAWKKLLAQFADPLTYLLLAAIAISVATWVLEGAEGVPFEALVILVIVVLNGVLGYVQEARAEQAVAALQKMTETTAGVLRDGREQRIPAADLVPGDILVLAEGDAVTADARIVDASSFYVAEAALTGESQPVHKVPQPLADDADLGDRVNMVFSGTSVARGRATAVVTGTGMQTEIGTIARLLGTAEDGKTPLQVEVAQIGRTLGIAVIVIALIVVGAILLTSDVSGTSGLLDVLIVGVSLAVAAVPEGLPAVLSVVLALGVQRMARQRAIVKKLSSVETLGSASVVCSDKTGTLTRNEMTIVRIVTAHADLRLDGHAHYDLTDPTVRDEVRMVIGGGYLANDASLDEVDGQLEAHGDPTDLAFLYAGRQIDDIHATMRTRFRRVGEIPFTSERKMMSTLEADLDRSSEISLITKGAPDVLLAQCDAEYAAGEMIPLTDARRREILAAVESLADDALRTLAVAYRPLQDREMETEAEHLEQDEVFLGLVGIIDPPRNEVREAIEEAQTAGIRIYMITGDHPNTAARIGADLGIHEPGSRVVSGGEIERLSEPDLRQSLREASIFARVSPEHKLRIISALQADGNIVAMTGDGVNDAPALKSADIGVAMGITGTDVSKEAADMILADDNFATIITAVREGRGIFANIRKFMHFLLSSNIGEVLTMFFGVMFASRLGLDAGGASLAVPLLATQILWINLLTDTGPALAMGVDPAPDDVMEARPRKMTDRVIDREMWINITLIGAVMAAVSLSALDMTLPGGVWEGSGTIEEARTMAFTTLVFAQLFNTFNSRAPRASAFHHLFTNHWLWGAIALSTVLQVAVVHVPVMNTAFSTSPLDAGQWGVAIGLASLVLVAGEVIKVAGRVVER